MFRLSIFSKVMLLIFVLLVPILTSFFYSNQASVGVVREEIENEKLSQLAFFVSQVDAAVEQLGTNAIMLSRNPNIRQYQENYLSSPLIDLNRAKTKQSVLDMLLLQSLTGTLQAKYTVFSPSLGEYLSSSGSGTFDPDELQTSLGVAWHFEPATGDFVRHIVEPYSATDAIGRANVIVEVRFAKDNIVRLLDRFKAGGSGDPLWFTPGMEPILNADADRARVSELLAQLPAGKLKEGSFSARVTVQDEAYLATVYGSRTLPWYMADYVPLEQVLQPITRSRNMFIVTIALLIALSLLAAGLLYREVQLPIRKLVKGVQSMKRGDYSVRLESMEKSEFGFLFLRFNELAAQIGDLVDRVFKEEIRSKEATLKQLQSQINPHFLYNCLAFIMSMGKMKQHEAVVAMAYQLGKYYRYTTRLESSTVRLADELDLIGSYLQIQQMRMQRLETEIDVPEEMRGLEVPRLLLQPIVENAVLHGIEPRPGPGLIRIGGFSDGPKHVITVENDGIGMDTDFWMKLNERINAPLREETGFGLWNVNQRLKFQYGPESELRYEPLPEGGVRAVVVWYERGKEEETT